MAEMTEEERQAEFRRRRDEWQAAVDEQIASRARTNLPWDGTPPVAENLPGNPNQPAVAQLLASPYGLPPPAFSGSQELPPPRFSGDVPAPYTGFPMTAGGTPDELEHLVYNRPFDIRGELSAMDRSGNAPPVVDREAEQTAEPPVGAGRYQYGIPDSWLQWEARNGRVTPTGFTDQAPAGSRMVNGRYVGPGEQPPPAPYSPVVGRNLGGGLTSISAQSYNPDLNNSGEAVVTVPRSGGLPQVVRPGERMPQAPTAADLIRLQGETQLSPQEQQFYQRANNGLARIQQDVREGKVDALTGARMTAQLQQQLMPLTARARDLPVIQHMLAAQVQREALTHAAVANEENRAYHVAQAARPGGGPPISPDGQWVETRPGHFQHISEAIRPEPRPPRERNPATDPAQLGHIETRIDAQMKAEAALTNPNRPSWATSNDPVMETAERTRRIWDQRENLALSQPVSPEARPRLQSLDAGISDLNARLGAWATNPVATAAVQDLRRQLTPLRRTMAAALEVSPTTEDMPNDWRERFQEATRTLNRIRAVAATGNFFTGVQAPGPGLARPPRTLGAATPAR